MFDKQGKFGEAMPIAREGLAIAEESNRDEHVATFLNWIARLHQQMVFHSFARLNVIEYNSIVSATF